MNRRRIAAWYVLAYRTQGGRPTCEKDSLNVDSLYLCC